MVRQMYKQWYVGHTDPACTVLHQIMCQGIQTRLQGMLRVCAHSSMYVGHPRPSYVEQWYFLRQMYGMSYIIRPRYVVHLTYHCWTLGYVGEDLGVYQT